MARGLTDKQKRILQFVFEYVQDNGYPPSIREIGTAFSIGSLRGVTVHLDALERKGYIERSNTPRSIRIVHPSYQVSNNAVMLPLRGQVAAGEPIYAEDDIVDRIPVPSSIVRNIDGAFLLRVRGVSMSGDGILPRDLVIIKPQPTANHGELVAVLLGDEATVKRIHFESGQVKLVPSNPDYQPIIVEREDARIIGKVVGLLRDYEGMAF